MCERTRCCGLYLAHRVQGNKALIVLECCKCGRLWHRREDGALVAYDQALAGQMLVGAANFISAGQRSSNKERAE